MSTALKRKTRYKGAEWEDKNVCIFTDQPVLAYLNKHGTTEDLWKTNENAYQLQNVKDSCGNYGRFISVEQPFLRCKKRVSEYDTCLFQKAIQ